jgi:phosphotransacetylase
MAVKKEQYYDLDDIGAIGVTKKRSADELHRDAEEMSAVIRAYKLGQDSVIKGSNYTSKRHIEPVGKGVKGKSRTSKVHSSHKTPTATK